jgi:hypothetical protein
MRNYPKSVWLRVAALTILPLTFAGCGSGRGGDSIFPVYTPASLNLDSFDNLSPAPITVTARVSLEEIDSRQVIGGMIDWGDGSDETALQRVIAGKTQFLL